MNFRPLHAPVFIYPVIHFSLRLPLLSLRLCPPHHHGLARGLGALLRCELCRSGLAALLAADLPAPAPSFLHVHAVRMAQDRTLVK